MIARNPMTVRLLRDYPPVEPSCIRDVLDLVGWATVAWVWFVVAVLVMA